MEIQMETQSIEDQSALDAMIAEIYLGTFVERYEANEEATEAFLSNIPGTYVTAEGGYTYQTRDYQEDEVENEEILSAIIPYFDYDEMEDDIANEESEIVVELHIGQQEIYADLFLSKTCRFSVAVCARGFGKSYLAAAAATTAIFELLTLAEEIPNKNVYIIAPTHDQVTDIYFPILFYEFGLQHKVISASRDTGRFNFANNVTLRLVSYEAIERLRGKGAYFVVLDEVSSWKKGVGLQEAWESIIQPCIVTRWSDEARIRYNAPSAGRALTISTPMGYKYLYTMFNLAETDGQWKSYHYDYTKSPYLDQTEVLRIKETIDPIKFAREYKALFQESGNSVFYCFDRKVHVHDDIEDFYSSSSEMMYEDVYCCIDFNVGIQATTFFALRGTQMQVIDEFKGHPDTEALGLAIATKYKGHKIRAFPDPTGKSRKTSAAVGITDFAILQRHGIIILSRKGSPSIIDSVAAVNAKLLSATGKVGLLIHPRCKGTIESLERTAWIENRPDTATIDKTDGVEHFSDGIRYASEFLFPIKRISGRAVKSNHF